jgi:hypothetical protein
MSGSPTPPGVLPHHRRGGRARSHKLAFDLTRLQRRDFKRADLVFEAVDHAGPSYEARIFLNNFGADGETPLTPEAGYAGSFHILGHGNCFGDVGHCDVDNRGKAPHDLHLPHPLTPARKLVKITDALKRILQRGDTLENVTVVPVAYGRPATSEADPEGFLKYETMRLLTYD